MKRVYITLKQIESYHPCARKMHAVRKFFGKKTHMLVTEKRAVALSQRFDFHWLACRTLLSERAQTEYERVRAAGWADYARVTALARAEYNRVTAPAWAEYNRVTALAQAEYERVTVPAWAEYERVTAPALAEFARVTAPAWAEYERVTAAAWARCYISQ